MKKLTLLVALLALGCSSIHMATSRKAISGHDCVSMSLRVETPVVDVGEAFRTTIVLMNEAYDQAVLRFPSSCQVGILVWDSRGELIGSTSGVCLQAPTELWFEPRETLEIARSWRGEAMAPGHEWPLPAGRYTVAGGFYRGGRIETATREHSITVY